MVWDDRKFPAGAVGVVGGGAIHEDRTLRVVLPKRLSWSSYLFQSGFNLRKIFSLPAGEAESASLFSLLLLEVKNSSE